MKYKVVAYGLTEEQVSHLEAALPEGYEVTLAECVTGLIITNAVCSIVDTARLDKHARMPSTTAILRYGPHYEMHFEIPKFKEMNCNMKSY